MASRVYGGIVPEQYKEPTFSREIRKLENPEKVYLPVETPDFSMPYRKKIQSFEKICANVCAPFELRFTGLQKFSLPQIEDQTFGVFETDFESVQAADEKNESQPVRKFEEITGEEILQIAKEANIIDEYDGKFLYQKLLDAKERGVKNLWANAIDDEPYVSCSMSLLYKMRYEIGVGLEFAGRVLGIKAGAALLYANVGEVDSPLKNKAGELKVHKLYGKYPVYKRQASQYRKDKNEMIGVAALVHLYYACRDNVPQTTCFITVAGDCVANPCNLQVPLGTPVYEVLEKVGLIKNPQVIILGGPMTGVGVEELDVPIMPTTRAVLAFEENRGASLQNDECIGCGKCVLACPRRLMPYYIRKYVKANRVEECMHLHAERCIECGCCSFVCPEGIDLVSYVKKYEEQTRILREKQNNQTENTEQKGEDGLCS